MALAPINAFQVILGFESSSTIIETLDSHTAELIIDKIIVNQNVGGGGTGTPYNDSELRDEINALKSRVSTLETYIANQIEPVSPSAFSDDDWGMVTGLEDRQIVFTINSLPHSGTAPITAIQYLIGGQWTNLTGVNTGPRVVTMPQSDTLYESAIRAVSSVGPGQPSGPKSARSGKEEVVNPVPASEVVTYTYQNSLFDHQYNGNADKDTRVPNWTHRMATAAGLTYKASAKFGFAHEWELPPNSAIMYEEPQWPDGVIGWTQSWEGMSSFNLVTFVPDNFDSFSAPPDTNSTNPQSPIGLGRNYVERLLEMIDAWEANAPMPNGEKRRYCVYAGWADFKPASGGGDWNTYTPAQLQTYLDWSFGDYQAWYVELITLLKAARPNLEIELLDIQRVMMDTWRNTALNTLTGARLWEDNSPHGTETWYLLASIVYYMEIFKAKPPANFNPLAGAGEGSGVDPVLVDNWAAIVDYAWDSLANATAPEQPSSQGLLAVGLSGVTDYCASQPFINILKTARPWEARSTSAFTFLNPEQMISGGHVDSDRNPIRIPPGANRVGTLILTEIAAEDTTMAGRYRLTWTGDGLVNVQAGQNTVYGDRWAEFDYTPNGANLILIEVSSIDSVNPIKFVSCINLRYTAIYEAGEIFRPEWVELVKDFKLFRFMDWQKTNFSTLSAWNDRTRVTSFTWARDVPVEIMVQLCNKLNVGAWFNFPHLATDDFIVNFATYVRDNLNDDLVARYEYSNEVWNWQFSQAQWANDQAAALWPDYLNQDGWMQFYGGKVAEMSMLLDTVYTGIQGRHIKVITTQTGYNGLEYGILNAPRWVAMQAGRQAPKDYVDELAVTGYFGHTLSGEDGTAQIQAWRQSLGSAMTISRMKNALIDEIDGLVAAWSYLKPIADENNLDMVMYEGGTHIVPAYSYVSSNGASYDSTLFPFLESFNYSETMAELYIRAMTEFTNVGGAFFNVFVEMERVGNNGFWGAMRHSVDINPRWNAIAAFNAGVELEPEVAQRVILVSDYAGDCDDAAALAIVAKAHQDGDINLLGVVASSTVSTSAPGIRGQLNAYGLQDIPVYAYQGSTGTYNNTFSAAVRDQFGIPGQTRTAFQDDVVGLRTMLAAAPDASVKVIDVGAPVSGARLLDSPADAISPLTGMQLVAAKVVGLWQMAGEFTTTRVEYNADRHIPSTQRVYQDWPTPVIAHGAEVGADLFTGAGPGTTIESDPVKMAFVEFDKAYSGLNSADKRQSWDPACAYHAIYGDSGLFGYGGQNGTITVSSTGVTSFSATPVGNRSIVTRAGTIAAIEAEMQAVINAIAIPMQPIDFTLAFDEGTGTVVTAEEGAPAFTMSAGATWLASPLHIDFNGTNGRLTTSGNDRFVAFDMLIGAVFRVDATGTRIISAVNGTQGRVFQFRTSGDLEYVSIAPDFTATVISSSPNPTVGQWALGVAFVTDTTVVLRLNGVEVGTGTFPQRGKVMGTHPLVIGARSFDGVAFMDHLDGGIAAYRHKTGAVAADIAAFEASLRSIATAKGITLP